MLKDREPCHVHGIAEWDMTEWLNDNSLVKVEEEEMLQQLSQKYIYHKEYYE